MELKWFDALQFSSGVCQDLSDFSQSGDAHCSADSIHFAISCFLD